MIKNSIDFDYAIEQITSEIKNDIQHQGSILESDKINNTFKSIEENLNKLYEKTRYLEDSIQYARVFLDTKVKDFNEEMSSIIKELNTVSNVSKNLAYISYNVPLRANIEFINDRDITQPKLSPLQIDLINKDLILGAENDSKYDFSSVYRVSDHVPYDDTLNMMKETNNYKTIYLEEQIASDGLTETLVIHFYEPVVINTIDIDASNCSIKNIRFGLINGVEEFAGDYNIDTNNVSRACIYVKFDLVCTNFNTVTYKIDKNKMTDNLWNDLKEFEIAKTTNLDKINKLNAEFVISRTVKNKLTGKTQAEERFQSEENKSITSLKMYSYIFGINKIEFKYCTTHESGYFISDYINVGTMYDGEYLTLDVKDYSYSNSGIEYALLDGEKEIPMIPMNTDMIKNEPIFKLFNDTRFLMDSNANPSYVEPVIKKDGQVVDMSYQDALLKEDGLYSITYKPMTSYSIYTPINKEVRVKCYMRTYGTNIKDIPHVDSILIRKYGEDALWKNVY